MSTSHALVNLFAYGTLRCAKVRQVLLDKVPSIIENVTIFGYTIHPVLPHRYYPGLIKSNNSDANQSFVTGTAILGLTSADMAILDMFEDEYRQHVVSLKSSDPTCPSQAITYLWNNGEDLLDVEYQWSYEEFEKNQEIKNSFVSRTVEFRRAFINESLNTPSSDFLPN